MQMKKQDPRVQLLKLDDTGGQRLSADSKQAQPIESSFNSQTKFQFPQPFDNRSYEMSKSRSSSDARKHSRESKISYKSVAVDRAKIPPHSLFKPLLKEALN